MNRGLEQTRAHDGDRRGRRIDLAWIALIGALLMAALVAGGAALYQQFYSPTAFVERYLSLLADGDAAAARAVPGVAIDSTALEAAGLPQTASDALLRHDALARLDDIRIVSTETVGDVTTVTVSYTAGSYPGRVTFEVESNGWIGVAPTWRFAQSPLAVMNLTVDGSMQFSVNGFEIDKRQVSPEGADADPLAPVSLLVFSPGLYSVSVDTSIASTPGVAVLSDAPATNVPIHVEAHATEQFVEVVQQRVDEFLSACTTQQVLQPTGCPFGYVVQDRISDLPVWSIAQSPLVTVEPDGAGWKIPATAGVAHIDVPIRSLYDGTVRDTSEDVPFELRGTITILADGSASILLAGADSN